MTERPRQFVPGCMDAQEPPFPGGTLAGFRKRLTGEDLGRRLTGRAAGLAARANGSGAHRGRR